MPNAPTAPESLAIASGTPQQHREPFARLLHAHPETAFDYLEFRRLLAGQITAFAAERGSEEDMVRLQLRMQELEDAHSLDDPAQEAAADAAFHQAVYQMAGNAIMTHVMGTLFHMLKDGVFYDRSDLYLRRGVRDGFMRQHRAIYAAIVARNPEAARAAADAHIASTAEALREAQRADQRREVSVRRMEGLALTQKPRGEE